MASLLDSLREAGADEQAAALAQRAAAHAPLDNPDAVAWLLDSLREAGADEQAAALLARDPAAHAALDDPAAVACLLDSLREAGADEQAAALAQRAAAHVPLDDPYAVASLLDELREAGAHEQAAALADRLPGRECSSSSASKETARIGSGSAGRPTAPRPRHGAGKTWTYDLSRPQGQAAPTQH